jgi:hypothetical protein
MCAVRVGAVRIVRDDLCRQGVDVPDNPGADPTINLTPNSLIQKLKGFGEQGVAGGATAEKLVPLLGYVGDSGEGKDIVYLYLQLDLGSYYRIARSDILYSQPVSETDPAKPTKILVRASAQIELIHTGAASFLMGNIAASCTPVTTVCPGQDAAPAFGTIPVTTGPHCQQLGTVPVTTGPHCLPTVNCQ